MSVEVTKDKVEGFLKMWIMLSATVFPVLYFLGDTLIVKPVNQKFINQKNEINAINENLKKIKKDHLELSNEFNDILTSKNFQNLKDIAEDLDKHDLKDVVEIVEKFETHNRELDRSMNRIKFEIERLQDKDKDHDGHIQNLFYGKQPKNSYLD